MDQNKKIPPRQTGIAHLISATRYSYAGLRRLLAEAAFRHELLAGAALMFVFFAVGASWAQLAIMSVLILITMAVEALNTAIEEIVDLVSPEWSQAAGNAKDLGSFAVMCLLCADGVYAGLVIVTSL